MQRTFAQRDELERAFRQLPLEQRAVIVLHHYMGLSGDEIGRILDLPAGTVRSRLTTPASRCGNDRGRFAPGRR